MNMIVEIPKGSKNKYEYNPATDKFVLSKVVLVEYPFNYGFFPNTLSEDGDPLDAIVFTDEPLVVGCSVEVIPVCVFRTYTKEGVADHKIVCVPKVVGDSFYAYQNRLSAGYLNRIWDFYFHYKPKEDLPTILGFDDDFQDIINKAQDKYDIMEGEDYSGVF